MPWLAQPNVRLNPHVCALSRTTWSTFTVGVLGGAPLQRCIGCSLKGPALAAEVRKKRLPQALTSSCTFFRLDA